MKEKLKWFFFVLLILSICFDYLGNFDSKKYGLTSIDIINFYTIIEGLILFVFFYRVFYLKKNYKKFILFLLSLFIISWSYHYFFQNNTKNIDNITFSIETISLIFLCILFYYQKIKRLEKKPIHKTFEFWLITAVFIQFSINFFIFLIPLRSEAFPMDYLVAKIISRITNIIFSILVTISFFINPANQKVKEPKQGSIYNVIDF